MNVGCPEPSWYECYWYGLDCGRDPGEVCSTAEAPGGAPCDLMADSQLLAEDAAQQEELGIYLHPAVSINGITYRGYLDGADIFDFICASFIREPRICMGQESFSSSHAPMTDGLLGELNQGKFSKRNVRNIVFAVIGVLLLLQITFLIWYRRRKHSQMS